MTEKFWSENRFLVTGGYGFLGQHLICKLKKLGATQIDIPTHTETNFLSRDETALAMKGEDIVIHLAARVGGIKANQDSPATFFYENMQMGMNVISEARRNKVKKVVIVGTTCSYPKITPIPFKEDDLWNGYPEETNAPYGIAKKALLVMSQAYKQQFGFNFAYVIPTNMYGPRDNYDLRNSHVIPAIIRKVSNAIKSDDRKIDLWGTGSPTRDFLFVEDAADGILQATLKYSSSEPVNLGSGQEVSIKQVAETICKLMNYNGQLRWDINQPDGQPRRCLDSSKAYKEFGWKAKTSLEEGLKKTIDWYLNFR